MQSDFATIELLAYAVAFLISKGAKILKKSSTATVIDPKEDPITVNSWLKKNGREIKNGKAILFKRVSSDLKTQEGTKNETLWSIGATLDHHAWNPDKSECGEGKFHACPRPYLCDTYRSELGDKYIAVEIAVTDLFVWSNKPEHPNKIAFRKGTVLFECNNFGDKIK